MRLILLSQFQLQLDGWWLCELMLMFLLGYWFDRLYMRINLDKRGIDILPCCVLFVGRVWSLLLTCCSHVPLQWNWHLFCVTGGVFMFRGVFRIMIWLTWFVALYIPLILKSFIECVFVSLWWFIWSFRNDTIFINETEEIGGLFDFFCSSFLRLVYF